MSKLAVVNGLRRIQDVSHDGGLFERSLLVSVVSSLKPTDLLTAFVKKRARALIRPGISGSEL
jgi:hypothetical protein